MTLQAQVREGYNGNEAGLEAIALLDEAFLGVTENLTFSRMEVVTS